MPSMSLELETPLQVLAHAKLNLGLEVTGRRDDGYHNLVTILQSISLSDEITLLPANEFSYQPIAGVEADKDLVLRAVELLRSRWQVELKASISIKKRVPIAAGLGGGSTDAASVLRIAGLLAGIPRREIEATSAELGSDVPFFAQGGTALGTGTGTILKPLPTAEGCWFAIVVPALEIEYKTAVLYNSLRHGSYSDGRLTRTQADRIRAGEPLEASLIVNTFEGVLSRYAAFSDACEALKRASGLPVHVSGAGPAMFSICRSQAEAQSTVDEMTRRGFHSLACVAIAPSDEFFSESGRK